MPSTILLSLICAAELPFQSNENHYNCNHYVSIDTFFLFSNTLHLVIFKQTIFSYSFSLLIYIYKTEICVSVREYDIYARRYLSTDFNEIAHTCYKFIKLSYDQHFNPQEEKSIKLKLGAIFKAK